MSSPQIFAPDAPTPQFGAAVDRIRRYDGGHNGLNAVSAIAAVPVAATAGPLESVTFAVKDNIDVAGLPTTAGSLALEGSAPHRSADLVSALQRSGAVLVAKTNQLELSGWLTFAAPTGYSALGGRALNPHDPRLTTGGSSSGAAVAVAAGYVDVAIGTDTGGSVLNPSGMNGMYGLRPTVGRVSRRGIVPVSPRQDTPGPMALSIHLVASTLAAISVDPALKSGADLDGCRIETLRVGVPLLRGLPDGDLVHWRSRLEDLRASGATLVPILEDLPWTGHGDLTVPAYDFRESIDAYLAGLTTPTGVHDFESLLAHYLAEPATRMPYGADNLLRSAAIDLDRDRAHRDVVWDREHARATGILNRLHDSLALDLVLFPQGGAAYLSSKSGYPALTIPGSVGSDQLMHFTTALATQPHAEHLLLEFAFGLEKRTGRPLPARLTEE